MIEYKNYPTADFAPPVVWMYEVGLLYGKTLEFDAESLDVPATIETRFRYNLDVKRLPANIPMLLLMIPAIQFAGMINPVSSLEGFGAFIGRIYPASHFMTISRGVFQQGTVLLQPARLAPAAVDGGAGDPWSFHYTAEETGGLNMPHTATIYRLGVKELWSLARDPMLLVLIAFMFTVIIHGAASAMPETLHKAPIAIVDEDGSALSAHVSSAIYAPCNPPTMIPLAGIDTGMDASTYTFALDIPPYFQRDDLAGKSPTIQLKVDATRMTRVFTGRGYIQQMVMREINEFVQRDRGNAAPPVDLALRARFNPYLEQSWLGALNEIINDVIMLSIILAGTALIREREHGTIEHLLAMPVMPTEIMLAKTWSMGLVGAAGRDLGGILRHLADPLSQNYRNDEMKTKQFLALVLLLTLFLPQKSFAGDQEARKSDTLTLYMENDAFGFDNNDRYYTHGTKISWISQDLSNYRDTALVPSWMHPLIERMPLVNDPEDQRSVSLSLGQNIYTPGDKERSDLIRDDRPYAGIMYVGLGLHSKNRRQMDTLEIDIGIVGRHSYAEDCQKMVHGWIDSADLKGWEHQLHDEPILNIYFERKWRALQYRSSGSLGFDLIPHVGIAGGNAYTGINLGGQVRFGWNIPNDFGTYLIRPGSDSSAPVDDSDPRFFRLFSRFGIHLFFAVDGNAVARNIFLDGNTFRDSHSVDKKPFVADLIGGIGMIIHRLKITYSYVYRTKEFETQKDEQHFGAVSLSFTF